MCIEVNVEERIIGARRCAHDQAVSEQTILVISAWNGANQKIFIEVR